MANKSSSHLELIPDNFRLRTVGGIRAAILWMARPCGTIMYNRTSPGSEDRKSQDL
jgi:hypothetical protein